MNNKTSSTNPINVTILGAGISGLTAAEQLIERGKRENKKFRITLIEKQDYLGGLAGSFLINGKYIPKYYHHVFHHDYITKKYLEKFGLLDKVKWKRIKMGICANSKVYNFTDPFSLLKFDYLSLWGRMRYGMFGAYVFTIMNPEAIPDEMNAREWLDKYAGKEVTEQLFHHLYARNKFNIPLEKISAKQFAFRLKAKEAMGKFGYPSTGLQHFIDLFELYLLKNNARIIKNADITKIDLKNKKIIMDKDKNDKRNQEYKYDILVSTIPLPVFVKLSKNTLKKEFIDRVSKIKYCPCVCVTFGTDKLLTNHYWLNLINERAHTLFQHSNLFDGYGKNNKINWILRYGGSEEDLNLSDETIKKEYLKIVKKYFPHSKITWSRVFREKYAEPVYDKDYAKKMPSIRCPDAKNVYFAGTFVGYPRIRNMNSSFQTGIDAVQKIFEDI